MIMIGELGIGESRILMGGEGCIDLEGEARRGQGLRKGKGRNVE